MNTNILLKEVQAWILQNLYIDTQHLRLGKSPFLEISSVELANQIDSKRKAKTKLPTWFNNNQVYYPPKLSIEQTSSEETARYKAKLVSGSMLDITGGFGVDSYFFSQVARKVIYCELQKEVAEVAEHNFKIFKQDNIETYVGDAFTFLKKSEQIFDWIYVDPARRDHQKNKVFLLSDCQPNIIENLLFLWKFTNSILLKTSPMLDISLTSKDLYGVVELHIISVKNEVKELLWILKKTPEEKLIKVKTINLMPGKKEIFSFYWGEELGAEVVFSQPQSYLYEPNASLMKAGAFKLISEKLGVNKLQLNSHLYTSDTLVSFPGRTFKIINVLPFNKKNLKKIGIIKANITTRNFPISVAEIRKISKIEDGGDVYLFFTTDNKNSKIILICEKIN